jgi:hypothetical protein
VIDPVVFQSLSRVRKKLKWYKREGVEGCLKGLRSRLKWTDAFYRQKGVEHALDHMCDSLNSVAVGISRWLCGWWTHSYPAGHCHHRLSGPTYSGTKNIVAIWTLAGEGEVLGKEVVSRSRKDFTGF